MGTRFNSFRFLGARLLILTLNVAIYSRWISNHVSSTAMVARHLFLNPGGHRLGRMLRVIVVLKDPPSSKTQILSRCLEVFIQNSYVIIRFNYPFT